MTDAVTVRSDFHRDVARALERHGLELMEEVDFPPYRADIYLPDYHAVVEVDGPYHSARQDVRRDELLRGTYFLEVLRVDEALFAVPTEFTGRLRSFLYQARSTRAVRWERCKDRTPWL